MSAVVFLAAVAILVIMNFHEPEAPSEAEDDGSATVGADEATAH